MRLQKIIWLMGRILFYVILSLMLIVVIFALVREQWWISLVAVILLVLTIYKGLVRLTVPANSVVVRDSTVVFFVPETIVRNRFDFVTRGQSIVELPDYGLLDRPFKVEIFSPTGEGRVGSCRLSLQLGYFMQPAAWQHAYDCFVQYQDGLSLAVRKQLLKRCGQMILPPHSKVAEDASHEFLLPIVSALNLELESFGLEVADARCSFAEGASLARLVASEQEAVDKGVTEEVFRWQIRVPDESPQKGKWALLGVNGKNEL